MAPETLAFVACCLVNFLDVMGIAGCSPALVPYGRSLGASLDEIASFNTIRFGFGIVSLAWMSRLADRRGAKFVLVLSVAGSGIAYLVQGTSWLASQCPTSEVAAQNSTVEVVGGPSFDRWKDCEELIKTGGKGTWMIQEGELQPGTWEGKLRCEPDCGRRSGVYMMMAGRATAGLFGGTMPVLRSWLTQVSLKRPAQLKRRLVILMSAQLTAPFTMAPVAGAMAVLGLYIPWLASAGAAALVLVFMLVYFQDAQHFVEPPTATQPQVAKRSSERPPIKDPVIFLMLIARLLNLLGIVSAQFLIPLTLEQPSFGLVDHISVSRTRENVASITGIVGIPFGVCSALSSTVLFLAISSRIGDRNTLRLAWCLVPPSIGVVGFLARKIWHLAIGQAFMGLGMGLFLSGMAPMAATYAARTHPTQIAQAQALPQLGIQLGMMLGPQIVAACVHSLDVRMVWMLVGSFSCAGLMLNTEVVFPLAARQQKPKPPKFSGRQSTLALETEALPAEKFVELVCGDLRASMLQDGPENRNLPLWNGYLQVAMRRSLREALPRMRKWDDATEGLEHLQDVSWWLLSEGTREERDGFRQMFPHICGGEDWSIHASDLHVRIEARELV